jgi:hypothetical protein
MSRFTKFALPTVTAFFVLGFSIVAAAKPPFLDDQPQIVQTPALPATVAYCISSNLTGSDLEIIWRFFGEDGTQIGAMSQTLAPGETFPAFAFSSGEAIRCEVSWIGRPSDLRTAFCNEWSFAEHLGGCITVQ